MVVRFFIYIWIRLNFYVNNTENVGQTLNVEVLAEVIDLEASGLKWEIQMWSYE